MCRLPLLVRGDLPHELLHLGLVAVVAEVALEVLDGLVVCEDVARAARDLLHVVAGAHYHLRQLELDVPTKPYVNKSTVKTGS